MGRLGENGLMVAQEEQTGAMKLFSVRGDLDFHWLRSADNAIWPLRGGIAVTSPWPEPSLVPSPEGPPEDFIPVDCLPMNTGCDGLILSDYAREALEPLLLPAGELWPVRVLGQQYWWFNCLSTVRALDSVATDAEWETLEGDWGEFRWITRPRRLAFLPEIVAGAPAMFRVPEFPQGVLFGGDELARAVSSNVLTGFRLDLVWTAADGGVHEPAGVGFGDAFEATDSEELSRKRAQARLRLQNRRAPGPRA